ncbi:MAG: galactosyldiacylglycerol synthase [Acidobacteria bacterium]|nr:galactosyldiacylglycerol synthase [Acidobacteriota bacterium]
MPVQLTDAASDRALGTVTDQQFQVLVDALEEEAEDDTDYYINVDTIDMLEAQGSDRELVTLLRAALNGREEMDIRWQRL